MERLQITELIHLIFDILRFLVLQVLFRPLNGTVHGILSNPSFVSIQLKNKKKLKIFKK